MGNKPYSNKGRKEDDKGPFKKKGDDTGRKPYKDGDRPFDKKRSFKKEEDRSDRPFNRDSGKKSWPGGKPFNPREDDKRKSYKGNDERLDKRRSFKKEEDRSDKPYNRESGKKSWSGDRSFKTREDDKRKPYRGEDGPFDKKRSFDQDNNRSDKPYGKRDETKPFRKDGNFIDKRAGKPTFRKADDPFDKPFPLGTRKVSGPFRKKFQEEKEGKRPVKPSHGKKPASVEEEMTLNKYIAHSGECSRRDAAELVKKGKVKVNGELVLEPGYRVKPEDRVTIAGKKLTPQRDFVYILLNKPKGFITTTEDPQERKTVMELIQGVEAKRVYPVGRLDRNTTGVLLLTNDGDLAQKLSHPSYEVKKVYQVTLNKALTKADFEKILAGLTLDDGEVKVDALSYLESKEELGIEIHSGRNRIVRRIFESLGYEVEKLDRVMYAGLTKKNITRGKWRLLNEKEIILLKHFKS